MKLTAEPQEAEPRAPLYHESLRPQFHFTARYWRDYRLNPQQHQEGWINDVNGLVYLDGVYHFFAQRWWSCWLHAVSSDLIHWEELPPAFGKDDKFGGTQSGGAIVDHDNTSGLAAGKTPVMIAFWSSTDNRRQCISYSNDRGRTWVKYEHNPVLEHPERDPTVFWYEPDQKWVMILYGPPAKSFVLLASKNLLQWEELSSIPDMYECPDMFSLPVDGDPQCIKWVVVDGDGSYIVGHFDGTRFLPETEKLRCEHGPNFYATRTWNYLPKEDARRIQVAWMRGGSYPDMPFNQQITFPCELTLRTFGDGIRMCRNPIREIQILYAKTFTLRNELLTPGINPLAEIKGELFDITAEIDVSQSACDAIVLNVRGTSATYTMKDQQLALSCGSALKLEPRSGQIQLRILIDRMSVEVFGNQGEVSMTDCVRTVDREASLRQAQGRLLVDSEPPLSFEAVGGVAFIKSLTVHELQSIWQ